MANYDELLAFDNKLKTHQRHLHFLTIERCESKNKPKPSFMWKTYKEKGEGVFPLNCKRKHSEKYGIDSSNIRGSVLWNNLPIKFKKSKFLKAK